MLQLDQVCLDYGSFRALDNVSLHANEGELVVLLGANGAGKSSIFLTMSGLRRPASGSIRFRGKELAGQTPSSIVHDGLVQCPEGRKLFPGMSVLKNLVLGGYVHRRDRRGVASTLEEIFALFPILDEKKDLPAGSLSGGQQQMVAIGRALLNQPRLLLCDEISLGLAPKVVKEIYQSIPSISANGTAIVLVEQDVGLAKSASDRLYCMLEGRVTLTGRSADLSREAIGEAYFGASHAVA